MPVLTSHTRSSNFWKRVAKGELNDCWLWTGPKSNEGYGLADDADGHYGSAQRAAWSFALGPIPAGMSVLHLCDVRLCCNPEHLFLGTHLDNMQDMKAKGRARGGRLPGPRKLTPVQVEELRARHERGATVRRLAAVYGISPNGVRHHLTQHSGK